MVYSHRAKRHFLLQDNPDLKNKQTEKGEEVLSRMPGCILGLNIKQGLFDLCLVMNI